MQSTWMLDWEGAVVAGPAVCGGKGWNLGRLHRYGFPVPVGGVLVAEAYNRFMDQTPVREISRKAAAIGARDVPSPEAVRQLAGLQQAITDAELFPETLAALERFMVHSGLADRPVAVRSSATAEDSTEHSFAGIHQSFLNLRGLPAIMAAIRRCYASLWTPQAVAYRRHRGLSDEAVACAVVICAMVTRPGEESPAAAGVAFACDPRTGRRDLITISAAPGLGEGVVSGSVNPEEISVHKENGILTLTLHTRGGRSDRVLTDEQALALARLTERVHWALGDGQLPQDVEWAFDGDRFWLLQARPVTSLPLVTFPGAEKLPVIWSNANLKEAVPGLQSTLSWSLIKPAITHIMYSHLPMVGYPVPPGLEVLRRFSGRAYFDLTAMQWAMYDALGLLPSEFIKGLGGHQPPIPVPSLEPLKGPQGHRRMRTRLRFILWLRRQMKELPVRIAEFRQAMRERRDDESSRLTSFELLAGFIERAELTRDFGPRFQAANMNAGAWTTRLMDLLSKFAPGRAQAMASALLAGSGKVTTAEHGYRLYDLAAVARTDAEAAAYLTRHPLDPQGWRSLPASSPFRRELERFLEEFGHRAVYEGEIANPRWNEDPTYLLEQVRDLLESGKTHSPREMARAARAAGEAELTRLPWYVRPLVRWLAGKAQEGAALREAAKSAFASIAEPGRRHFLEMGRRLVAAGKLDDPTDVFHLAWVELEMYLRDEWDGTGARALVADRKARDAAWLAEEPSDVYILDAEGHPAAMPGEVVPPSVVPSGDGNVLAGIGVSAGRATGVARVIRHPREGHLLQEGDVLVAPSTDPGWTPLFLRASAVVMEVGGYLSHGAIVAREYGLPAVVNIPGLLRTVRTGQRLVVDGDAGTVTVTSD
ncbi:hypothetical protein SY88_14110 [Clostridiales bacterium PH28_bin88]|nr:hypothetical protein SY88_14110 [Clostridiales bacterium PH28_bin88]